MLVVETGEENTGQTIAVPVPGRSTPLVLRPNASAERAGGTSVASRAATAGNVAPTGPTFPVANFVAIQGSSFAIQQIGDDWTFTAASCVWTYSGPAGRRFLVNLSTSIYPAVPYTTVGRIHQSLAINGDLIGQDAALDFSSAHCLVTVLGGLGTSVFTLSSARIISAEIGDAVQPIYASEAADAALSLGIERLTMTISEVGARV